MIRIAKFVTAKMQKNSFGPEELRSIFEFIITNYRSEVSDADYKKIASLLDTFVATGGEIILQ